MPLGLLVTKYLIELNTENIIFTILTSIQLHSHAACRMDEAIVPIITGLFVSR